MRPTGSGSVPVTARTFRALLGDEGSGDARQQYSSEAQPQLRN